MPIRPRRSGLVLLGSLVGACFGLVAFLSLRTCAKAVEDVAGASIASPFDSIRARVADFHRRRAR